MHRIDKYSQLGSFILSVWPNGWVFVYEFNDCGGFETRWNYLNFRYHAYFEEGVPWQLGKYRIWI